MNSNYNYFLKHSNISLDSEQTMMSFHINYLMQVLDIKFISSFNDTNQSIHVISNIGESF